MIENKYTIRVESKNPEYDDQEMREGVQVSGFVLLGMKNGQPGLENMQGMTIMELSKFFMTDTEACSVLRQAAAIADGMRNAKAIQEEAGRKEAKEKAAKGIIESLLRAGAMK